MPYATSFCPSSPAIRFVSAARARVRFAVEHDTSRRGRSFGGVDYHENRSLDIRVNAETALGERASHIVGRRLLVFAHRCRTHRARAEARLRRPGSTIVNAIPKGAVACATASTKPSVAL
jgi:hypothetical protein